MLDWIMHRRRRRGISAILALLWEGVASNAFLISLGDDFTRKNATDIALADGDNVQNAIAIPPDATVAQHLAGQAKVNATTSYGSSGGTEAITLTANKLHEITYTVSGRTVGTVGFEFQGGVIQAGAVRSADGVYSELLETDASTTVAMVAAGGFDGSVTLLSVKKIDAPVFAQGDLGKQPTLKIAGASKYLELDGISQTISGGANLNLGQGSWWCCAMVNPFSPNWQVIFGKGDNASADNIRMFLDPTNKPYVNHGSANYTFSTLAANTGVPNIIEWGIDALANEVFYSVNGVEERFSITLSGTGSNALDWFLGQDSSGSAYGQHIWIGDGSLLVDYMPDAAMRLSVRQELAAKHGVTLS